MPLPILITAVLLLDSWSRGDLTARITTNTVNGSVTIDTNKWTLRTDLSGACGSVNISIHKFPVIYGGSRDPCHVHHLGPSRYELSLGGMAQVAIDRNIRYDGCSLVLRTCGQQTCVNLESGSLSTWRAIVRSFVVGHVYFLQSSRVRPITAVAELALMEGMPDLNASLFFSDTCRTDNVQLLGSALVGHQPMLAKSRLELLTTEVMPYLVIKYQDRWACAEVRSIQPKEASAPFGMHGVEGSFSFRQESPFQPTQLSITLRRLRGLAGRYGIHALPVLARQTSKQNLCVEANAGDLWDPSSVGTATARSDHNSWQIGDLSGRHGALQGREDFTAVLTDWNLPLYGNNSVIGRSVIVFKAAGEPWACSTINVKEVVTALATFRKGVVGRIMFQQATSDPYDDLTVYVELAHVSDNVSMNHNWHVHEFPLLAESADCASAGGHFNPYHVPTGGNYSLECNPRNPLRCEAGDYAGKHAPVTLLAPSPARYLFTDSSTSLTGPKSIVGRPVVIHGAERASPRVACANVLLQPLSEGKTGLWLGPGHAGGELKVSQVSEFTPTGIHIEFHGLKGLAGGFHIHQLPVNREAESPCSPEQIQGHFNPFNVNVSGSPAPGNGTDDEYEVGDISGRHGSLRNLDNKTGIFQDTNLPLYGQHSVLGRSLVIHYANGSRMHCATLKRQLPPGGEWLRVTAEFAGNIRGRISLRQIVYPDGGSSDTEVLVDLQSVSPEKSLSWSILTGERGGGETYNPYGISNQGGNWSWCGPQGPQHCRVGDLRGKHGAITPGNRMLFTDTNLPLAGDFSVVRRTLALARDSLALTSPLLPDVPIISLVLPRVTASNRSALRDAVSGALQVPPWKVTFLPTAKEESAERSCQRVDFFIIGYKDTSALNTLQAKEPLGIFCTPTACCPGLVPSGSGIPGLTAVLLLISVSLVLAQL